jgi:hypothetical protein
MLWIQEFLPRIKPDQLRVDRLTDQVTADSVTE